MNVLAPRKVIDVAGRTGNDERCWERQSAALAATLAAGCFADHRLPFGVVVDVALAKNRERSADGTELILREDVCGDCATLAKEAPLARFRWEEPLHLECPFKSGLVNDELLVGRPPVDSGDDQPTSSEDPRWHRDQTL